MLWCHTFLFLYKLCSGCSFYVDMTVYIKTPIIGKIFFSSLTLFHLFTLSVKFSEWKKKGWLAVYTKCIRENKWNIQFSFNTTSACVCMPVCWKRCTVQASIIMVCNCWVRLTFGYMKIEIERARGGSETRGMLIAMYMCFSLWRRHLQTF